MKKLYTLPMTNRICLTALVLIAALLMIAGCVTPPSSTTTSSTSSGYYATETSTPGTTSPPSYVTEVTPFLTPVSTGQTSTQGPNLYTTAPTPLPADLSCLIYLNTQYYSYNTTAVSFDLKNPPMYINYTVIPFNITVNKYVQSKQGSNGWITLQYSDFAPYSWFEITARDKTTGKIYLQDGFGKAQGLSVYTTASLGPILNSNDLQIEMKGNNITATTGIWVKPVGNFDDPQNQSFPECKYWGGHPQNYLVYPTTTATPTWTPVNVQTPNNG
jgi:hypothetical protein